jgi:Flp pilus assembly protein TadD
MMKPAPIIVVLLLLAGCSAAEREPPALSQPAAPQASALLLAADASRDAGRYGEALQIYRQILLRAPEDLPARYGAAECLLGLGQRAEAKNAFDGIAAAREPRYQALAQQGRGLALLALNQPEEAAMALAAATETDPALWRAWNALGMLADLRRDEEGAAEDYAKALALKPDSALLHNNLGYSRLLSGNTDAALSELRKAAGLDPASAAIRNNLRLALAAKGNYRAATQGMAKEDQAMVLNNVGFVAMQRGDLASAETYLARAMESSSSFNSVASRNIQALHEMEGAGK